MSAPRFLFHPSRCTGCEACVVGCWMEHRGVQTVPWRRVHTYNPRRHPDLPVFHLSLACHHCEHPACLEHCPAGAYRRDPATGAVLVAGDACMGCRYCTWACPHDAPKFAPAKGTIEKCTFCQHRLAAGEEPACVARCPLQALELEPRDGEPGRIAPPGFHGWALRPGIRFTALPVPPRFAAPPGLGPAARILRGLLAVPEPRISLRGEWTLVLFTTILAVATAAACAGLRSWLGPAAMAAAMALSAAHLGRPLRAWRGLLNLRRSWLSRELALASLFLALSAGAALGAVPAWAAAAAGLAALFAVDRVYQVAAQVPSVNFHSAHTLFNGLYLAGILVRSWPLAGAAGALKLALYLWRKRHFHRQGRPLRPVLAVPRLLAGFLLPALLPAPWGAAAAVLGDLLDRCEYYDELELPSPAAAMNESMLAGAPE